MYKRQGFRFINTAVGNAIKKSFKRNFISESSDNVSINQTVDGVFINAPNCVTFGTTIPIFRIINGQASYNQWITAEQWQLWRPGRRRKTPVTKICCKCKCK